MRRRGPSREVPPPLEMLCLTALWQLEEGNVRDVQRRVAASRALAYTTVMTVLDRLARKGAVSRRKVGRAFVYAPQMSREVIRKMALKEFLEGFFDGSEEQLLAFLRNSPSQPRLTTAEIAKAVPTNGLDTALL